MSLFDNFFKRKKEPVVGKEAGINPMLDEQIETEDVETPKVEVPEVKVPEPPKEVKVPENETTEQKPNLPWWKTPNYVEAEKAYQEEAKKASDREMQRARRQRNALMMGDLANVLMQTSAANGGVWNISKVNPASAKANDRINELYGDQAKQAQMFAERMMRAQDKERQEYNAMEMRKQDEEYRKAKAEAEERKHQENLAVKNAEQKAKEAYQEEQLKIAKQRADAYVKYMKGRGDDVSDSDKEIFRQYAEMVAMHPEYGITESKEIEMYGVGTGQYDDVPVKFPKDVKQMKYALAKYNNDKANGKLDKKEEPKETWQSKPYFSVVPDWGKEESPLMNKKNTSTW